MVIPRNGPSPGYNEIQNPRRKNVLIDYDKFMEMVETNTFEAAKRDHQTWTTELLENGCGRDDTWTRSIAVGSKEFSMEVQSRAGGLALGRKVRKKDDDYQLREPANSYAHDFQPEKHDIVPKNTYLWIFNIYQQLRAWTAPKPDTRRRRRTEGWKRDLPRQSQFINWQACRFQPA